MAATGRVIAIQGNRIHDDLFEVIDAEALGTEGLDEWRKYL